MSATASEGVRLRATLTFEYVADPDDYGTADPVEMAAIDAKNFDGDPFTVAENADEHDYTVKVEPV